MSQQSQDKEYLYEDRATLIRRINEFPHIFNGSEDAGCNQLKDRYNILMDQIDGAHKSALNDPLKTLPFELWQDIINNLLDSYFEMDTGRWEIDILLSLTLISKFWRQSLLSIPTFWTRIRIHSTIEDLEMKLSTSLYLSRGLPLDIHTDVTAPYWDTIGPLIVAQAPRIRSLSLTTSRSSGSQEAASLLTRFLISFGKLSALETLSSYGISTSSLNLDVVLRDATSIRSITGLKISPETLKLTSMQKVRDLHVYQQPCEILPHIQNFRYLEDVSFLSPSTTPKATIAIPASSNREDLLKLTQIPWTWTRMSIEYLPDSLSWSLLEIISSTLYDLSIVINWGMIPNMIVACSHMTKLNKLTINLKGNPEFQPHTVIKPNSTIQHLDINIKGPRPEGKLTDEAAKATQSLVKSLITLASDVKLFSLSSSIDPSFIFTYLSNLQCLAWLSVDRFDSDLLTFPDMELTTAEDINLSGRKSTQILSLLSCPNVLNLSIHNFQGPDSSSFLAPLRLNLNGWLNLRSIDIASDDTFWENISLPCVERITIGSFGSTEITEPQHLSPSLLKELACNNFMFPSLNYLGMRRVPEWDILFIMLERRNFLPSKDAIAITKLGLPSFPSPIVLRPLVDRIRRRISDRPSNFDLSLQELAKAYFDRDLDGCGQCHCSFIPCKLFYSTFYHLPAIKRGRSIDNFEIPLYPPNDGAVLEACLERASWWKNTLLSRFERRFSCDRHDPFDLVEITEYTWAGLSHTLELTQIKY